MFKNPDLHMHSVFSDGTDSPEELINHVKEKNIDVFSLTDHDTFDGCAAVRKALKPGDPMFIDGIELSCADEFGKYHILGYCYNINRASLVKAVEITHNARVEKAMNRVRFLREKKGICLTDDEIKEILSNENPGKPHFADLMFRHGYIKSKEEGFAIFDDYHGKERRLTAAEAIDAILSAEGIPVLAHGILADGSEKLSEKEITERVGRLKGLGLMGLECYYSTFTSEQKEIMLSLSEKYNLLVTAGSDYHGRGKTISLGETNSPSPEKMERFYNTVKLLLG